MFSQQGPAPRRASVRSDSQVKSDPWKKGLPRARPGARRQLWSATFWQRLVHAAEDGGVTSPFSGRVLELICAENRRLYSRGRAEGDA